MGVTRLRVVVSLNSETDHTVYAGSFGEDDGQMGPYAKLNRDEEPYVFAQSDGQLYQLNLSSPGSVEEEPTYFVPVEATDSYGSVYRVAWE